MNDKNQAIALAKRLSTKDKIQYFVVQNTSCGCYDIVLEKNINNRKIMYPNEKNT